MDGFIYYATGRKANYEALCSVTSLRQSMPKVPVIVHTNMPDLFKGLKTKTVKVPRIHQKTKRIELLRDSPFNKTIYLDNDTYITNSCERLFELLDKKDLYLLPQFDAEGETTFKHRHYNSGVIASKKSEAQFNFLALWEKQFQKMLMRDPNTPDEAALTAVIKKYQPDFGLMPPKFNFRLPIDDKRAVILHSHNISRPVPELLAAPSII